MAIDTTPSTVATNALQAIPFSTLIGGPLDACIQAQAQAAKTSFDFINQVGLTIDPDTREKKAVNVTFQYNNNGSLATLVVPLITIVPIPYLAIDTVAIDFTANISAASSTVEETNVDTSLGVDADVEASLKIGPFGVSVRANANYSAKQQSKAAQDSRYSVEYTMNVKVEGGQADMPAGLQTMLNILQSSITSVGEQDMVAVTPASLDMDQVRTSTLQATIRGNNGLLAPGTRVKVKVNDSSDESPFESINIVTGASEQDVLNAIRPQQNGRMNSLPISSSLSPRVLRPFRRRYLARRKDNVLIAKHNDRLLNTNGRFGVNALSSLANGVENSGEATGVTNADGTVIFQFELKKNVLSGNQEYQGTIVMTADVPIDAGGQGRVEPQMISVPYAIVPLGTGEMPENYTFEAKKELTINAANRTGEIDVTVKNAITNGSVNDYNVMVTLKGDGTDKNVDQVFNPIGVSEESKVGNPTAGKAEAKTNNNGQVKFTFTLKDGVTEQGTYTLTISSPNGTAQNVTAKINVNTN